MLYTHLPRLLQSCTLLQYWCIDALLITLYYYATLLGRWDVRACSMRLIYAVT